jgi:3-oxoacyl-[acyl-carrier protein] reductase
MAGGTAEAWGIAGKVALVSGGNRNIGRAIALALADAGVHAAILYRQDENAAREVCAEISARGVRAASFQADLADALGLAGVVKKVESALGEVDILVNNAAIRPNPKFSEISVADWDEVFATNLRAPFFLSQAVLPAMIRKGWGRIINLGGTDAYWGKVRRAHGAAAKLGLVGLTRALALEVARFGVTVNIVVPGPTDTVRPRPEWYPDLETGFVQRLERIPMARLGKPEEVADACLFLASARAGYTTGQELFVSGGAAPMVRQPFEEYGADEFRVSVSTGKPR